MTTVTAKVFCQSKISTGEGEAVQTLVTFGPDYRAGRNAAWAKSTPHLNLTMTLNAEASGLFEASKAYTLSFVETED